MSNPTLHNPEQCLSIPSEPCPRINLGDYYWQQKVQIQREYDLSPANLKFPEELGTFWMQSWAILFLI